MGDTVKQWRQARLRKIIETRFKTQAKLAQFLGVDPSYITQLLTPDTDDFRESFGDKAARSIEQKLGLKRGELDRPYPDEPPPARHESLGSLGSRSTSTALGSRASVVREGEPELAVYDLSGVTTKRHPFPVISRVSAGPFEPAIDPYAPGAAEFWEDTDVPISQRTFGLIVKGESMVGPAGAEFSFPPGTIIVVDPAERARSGDFVVVRNNDWDDATFKQLVIDGGIRLLKPLNPDYPTVQMPPETVLCGVVVDQVFRKKVRRGR